MRRSVCLWQGGKGRGWGVRTPGPGRRPRRVEVPSKGRRMEGVKFRTSLRHFRKGDLLNILVGKREKNGHRIKLSDSRNLFTRWMCYTSLYFAKYRQTTVHKQTEFVRSPSFYFIPVPAPKLETTRVNRNKISHGLPEWNLFKLVDLYEQNVYPQLRLHDE